MGENDGKLMKMLMVVASGGGEWWWEKENKMGNGRLSSGSGQALIARGALKFDINSRYFCLAKILSYGCWKANAENANW